MPTETYEEILKVWKTEMPDDFDIHCELYYEMFAPIYDNEETES